MHTSAGIFRTRNGRHSKHSVLHTNCTVLIHIFFDSFRYILNVLFIYSLKIKQYFNNVARSGSLLLLVILFTYIKFCNTSSYIMLKYRVKSQALNDRRTSLARQRNNRIGESTDKRVRSVRRPSVCALTSDRYRRDMQTDTTHNLMDNPLWLQHLAYIGLILIFITHNHISHLISCY